MSTTTIRMPEDLKEKVARAAKRAGKTSHGFILDAISEKADLEDRRADFVETAERRHDGIAASGMTIPWSQMRKYLERRADGAPAVRPKARRLAR